MLNARRAVRRHCSARRLERRQRRATLEEQQNTLSVQVERDESATLQQNARAEYPDVERLGARKIVDVECRLDDATDRRGGCVGAAGLASFGHVHLPSRRVPLMAKAEPAETLTVDGREVRITHPDKPYFTRD